MRAVLGVAGRIVEADVSPEVEARLLDAFRDWRRYIVLLGASVATAAESLRAVERTSPRATASMIRPQGA